MINIYYSLNAQKIAKTSHSSAMLVKTQDTQLNQHQKPSFTHTENDTETDTKGSDTERDRHTHMPTYAIQSPSQQQRDIKANC